MCVRCCCEKLTSLSLFLSLTGTNPSADRVGHGQRGFGVGTVAGYEKTGGYGSEAGQQPLRDLIVKRFYSEKAKINASEIFVSDGSKCDISRMQQMFGPGRKVAVQDPAYPAYVDSSVINGHCTTHDEKRSDTARLHGVRAGQRLFSKLGSCEGRGHHLLLLAK